MKKILGIFFLAIINGSVLFLVYGYSHIACSIKVDNICNIPYEPSGMQFFVYMISLPFFMILACLSILHSYYFDLKKSLSLEILIIWFSYFSLLFLVNLVHYYLTKNDFLYYGSLLISCSAIFYVIFSTYRQLFFSSS